MATDTLKICRFCKHPIAAIAYPRTILVCDRSTAFPGQHCVVDRNHTCKNFTPLSRQLPDTKYKDDGTRLIPLTQAKFAIVDAADYQWLIRYKWYIKRSSRTDTLYAITLRNKKKIPMHRLIMDAPKGMVVDHIDHNGLNNSRKNLRLCTQAQNVLNSTPPKGKTSKYKGVSLHKKNKTFIAQIADKNKKYYLGSFKNEIDAAKAYDKKAKQLFKQFANPNFP